MYTQVWDNLYLDVGDTTANALDHSQPVKLDRAAILVIEASCTGITTTTSAVFLIELSNDLQTWTKTTTSVTLNSAGTRLSATTGTAVAATYARVRGTISGSSAKGTFTAGIAVVYN